jgi:hypothetical protein
MPLSSQPSGSWTSQRRQLEKALPAAERSPLEQLELDPTGERLDALERDAEQSRDLHRRARRDDQALAGLRPLAPARLPGPATRQPAGAPASIARSSASSVPCSRPTTGTAGKSRSAASFAGVR